MECAYSQAAGEDTGYRMSVQPGGFVDATLSMPDADGVLWMLAGCGASSECVGYADAGFDGEDEHLRYENTTGSIQSLYLVVDSFEAGTCADFQVQLSCAGTDVPTGTTSWSALKGRFRTDTGKGETP
jgi:hypothetical protein